MFRVLFAAVTGGQALMIVLSLLATFSVIATLALVSDRLAQLIITVLIALVLWLGARAATSSEAHRMRTARYAIFVFGGLLSLVVTASSQIDPATRAVLEYIWPGSASFLNGGLDVLPMALVLFAMVTMFGLLMWFLRSAAPLGTIPKDPFIREASYLDRRAAFVSVLKSRLESVDEELRWHHEDFVDLRAEVDVRNSSASRRRVADLVEAIKLNRDADIFVVVGVPGAGKSVALRKSCMDLLKAQRSDERTPIYVNLKEWLSRRRWAPEAPPTDAEFSNFVRTNVRSRLPDRAVSFFDEHFDRLVDAGEIFFLFDSFDEIPGVLDADESSKLLDAVSSVIVRYLRAQARGRGVIASRYYRRPRLGQEKHVQLDVRPFSERQIAQVVSLSASRSDKLKQQLFKDRPDLGALARNPFTLSLILLHWEAGKGPPRNQSELFASYINRSVADAREGLEELGLTPGALGKAMEDISWAMFESDQRGLEMTVRELRDVLQRDDIDDIVDALVAARLMRKAPRTHAISFVHRRFNEYFLVARWLSGVRKPPFEAIPTDNRFRDALVLYAEVATDDATNKLAQYCWENVNPPVSSDYQNIAMRSIYCLRFLTEAFRARQGPLASFQNDLGKHIVAIMRETDDILARKVAVEGVGLLNVSDAERVLLSALDTGNRWITDTAFTACRYLGEVPSVLERKLFAIITARDQAWLLMPDPDFKFMIGLADAFNNLARQISAFRLDMWIGTIAGILALLIGLWIDVKGALTAIYILLGLNVVFVITYFITSELRRRVRVRDEWLFKAAEIMIERTSGVLRPDISQGRFASARFNAEEAFIGMVRAFPIVLVYTIQFRQNMQSNIYLGCAYLAAVLAIVPFFSVSLWVRTSSLAEVASIYGRFRRWLQKGFNECLNDMLVVGRYMLPLLGLIAMGGLIGLLMMWFVGLHWILGLLAAGGSIVAFLGMAILVAMRAVGPWWRDRGRLSKTLVRFSPTRASIAEAFNAFETDAARLQFVQWVRQEAETQENLALLSDVAGNPWPSGGRPNAGESEASIMLAQLDARWMKLDI